MNQSKPAVTSVTAVAKLRSPIGAFGLRCRDTDTDTAQLTTMYMLTLALSEDSSNPRLSSSDNDLHFYPAALATSATFLLSGLSICEQGKQSQENKRQIFQASLARNELDHDLILFPELSQEEHIGRLGSRGGVHRLLGSLSLLRPTGNKPA